MNNLVSIITPFYNTEKFLQQAIESVIQQNHNNWELLLINDGSNDDSKNIALSYDANEVRYFEQVNKGVSAARNLGLKNMKGDYFCFLDADDRMTPNSLTSRLEVFAHNNKLAFVGGAQEQRDESMNQTILVQEPQYTGLPRKGLITLDPGCFINCGTWLIKRQMNRRYSFLEGWTHSEDLAFFLSISDQGRLDYTTEIVQLYRRHGTSAMENLQGLESGYWNYYKYVKVNQFHESNMELLNLNLKIRKIMALSYLDKGKAFSAFKSAFRIEA